VPGVDDPGSPAAVAAGCTCDPVLNSYGYGTHTDRGHEFWPDSVCPLHGFEALLEDAKHPTPQLGHLSLQLPDLVEAVKRAAARITKKPPAPSARSRRTTTRVDSNSKRRRGI
jgi:hypothetical protein